ncbi:DUF7167 family protein [Aneurinibacillus migulanus]|uniref:DUF7167 domain-containing protein n=2 Tax=Aneurinibacillus migulanus TaxID=47500 RepID=A0A0D1XVN7_ANEMI|nr:hypothetical protein [Aneurinibacillus migulanus]KIV56203.1 hypothetical protein TS65_13350 [Aneurinibacillus migulanus]KON84374.1 hypothetical protein AF333_30495 [Aneurinibacillus migulanus]MED0893813.1 hypothetical protein [Aneurinibacillus migulanus]MED1614492.1 hypothetical protein [Aneurinibacillus migulanus]SDI83585.1 hypothetical protein SAMN04487909_108113 [Aneurinibacillus migulanus]
MPKYEFRVSTGYVGCKRTEIVEIDEDELAGMTEEEKEEYVEEEWAQWVWENIDGGFSKVEDEEK